MRTEATQRGAALASLALGVLLLGLAALGAAGDWQRAEGQEARRAVAISVGEDYASALLNPLAEDLIAIFMAQFGPSDTYSLGGQIKQLPCPSLVE